MTLTLLALAVLASPACTGDGGRTEGGAPTSAPTLAVKNFAFQPATLEVPAGAVVTVRNEDGAAHTATADEGSFDTGNVAGGATSTFTAPRRGEVPYKCDIHQYMRGVIRVRSS